MTDAEEFAELARQAAEAVLEEKKGTKLLRKARAVLPPLDAPVPYGAAPAVPGVCFSQYARLLSGYSPVAATLPALPAGVYTVEMENGHPYFAPRPLVTDDLVRLPDTRSDEVLAEIERFWGMKDVLARYGYRHRRGFLLWGPPAGGKSSTVALVLKELIARNGVALLMDVPDQITWMSHCLREVEPDRHIVVVMEDLDELIERHGAKDVLGCLDGELSIAGAVYIATTNYPERLDGRVINRPSRFDRIVKIGMPSEDARRLYLQHRELPLSPEQLDHWVDTTKGLSIAHLKELVVSVLCFGNDFEEELRRMRAMAITPKSDEGRPIGLRSIGATD